MNYQDIPAYKKVYTKDLPKTTEIIDGLSNLWFAVTLKRDIPELSGVPVYSDLFDECYRVEVSSFKQSEEPLLIVSRPTSREQQISSYNIANWLFNEYVINYSSVVKAVTRDIQNIEIYKDKINYTRINPACCATCKFCQKSVTPKDYVFGVSNKLECWNPNNQKDFDFNRDAKPNKNPICGMIPPPPVFIHPQVSPFGLCKNYVIRQRKWIPTPNDSVSRIIDERIDYKFSHLSSDPSLSSQISAIVNETIDRINILSVVGGDSVYNDVNGNGIDDEDEMIIGNLGA